MQRFLLRWLINAIAIFIAALLVPGVRVENWLVAALAALIFGLLNALVRPLLTVLTCPLIVLTLGLFTLVINALLFMLTAWVSSLFDLGFYVNGFWPAFWGALVTSIVSMVLSLFVRDERENRARAERG